MLKSYATNKFLLSRYHKKKPTKKWILLEKSDRCKKIQAGGGGSGSYPLSLQHRHGQWRRLEIALICKKSWLEKNQFQLKFKGADK